MRRRAFLAGAAALAAAPALPRPAAGRELSWVATHGHAGFVTAQLYPGARIRLRPAALRQRIVALTIDDGPDPAHDPQILRTLAEHGVPATYFLIGQRAAEHPGLVRAMAAAGHEIGNHTWDHQRLITLTPEQQVEELRRTNALLTPLAGRPPRWFRPPFGSYDEHTLGIAAAEGLETILWTVDSQDYRGIAPEVIAERVRGGLTPGAIVLTHSTAAGTVAALPGILAEAKRQGVRFVTMTEWKALMERAAG